MHALDEAQPHAAIAALAAALVEHTTDAIVAVDADFVLTLWSPGAEQLYGWSAEEVLGSDARTVACLDGADQQRDAVDQELVLTGSTRGELTARRKDGSLVEVEVVAVALPAGPDGPGGFVGIHRDMTDHRERERVRRHSDPAPGTEPMLEEITDDAERVRREGRQELVAELGLRALRGDDLQAIIDEATLSVARTLDVPLVAVAEMLPGRDRLLLRAGTGWPEGAVGTAIGGAGSGSFLGYAVMTGEPVLSDDLIHDPRFEPSAILAERRPAVGAAVVIAGRDGPFGVLSVFADHPHRISPEDVGVLQAVANVVATAVQHAAVDGRLQEAREAERGRIARDLHDEALQGLTHALVLAGRSASGDGAEALRARTQLAPLLTEVGQQLHGAIYDLRLGGDEQRPFADLLDGLVEVHRSMSEHPIELRTRDLPPGILGTTGTGVLRILGEALTNARRHGGAGQVRVRAWGSGDALCADVGDDGRGFDPDRLPPPTSGKGLAGMAERAAVLGARLDVDSAPGRGTRIRLRVPLREGAGGSAGPVRIVLVEDHAAVREAMAAAFGQQTGFEVVGQAASMAQARAMLQDVDVDVDVAIVDLGLPDGYGADLIPALRDAHPQAQALVLSATLERGDIARAVARGAAGALHKAARLHEIVTAVERLRAGETLMPMEEIVELLRLAGRERERELEDRVAIDSLTPRELEVLQALAEGLNSQQAANRLFISVRTQRNHVANILAKLGVHSQVQALVFALRHDLVVPR